MLDGNNKVVNKIVQKLDSLRRHAHIAVEIPKWASKVSCDCIKTFDWIIHWDHWQWILSRNMLTCCRFQTSGQQMSCCLLLANLKIVRTFRKFLEITFTRRATVASIFYFLLFFWHCIVNQNIPFVGFFSNFLGFSPLAVTWKTLSITAGNWKKGRPIHWRSTSLKSCHPAHRWNSCTDSVTIVLMLLMSSTGSR